MVFSNFLGIWMKPIVCKGLVIIYQERGADAKRGWVTNFYAWPKGGLYKKLFKYIASKNCKPLIQLEGPQLLKLHHKNNVYEH